MQSYISKDTMDAFTKMYSDIYHRNTLTFPVVAEHFPMVASYFPRVMDHDDSEVTYDDGTSEDSDYSEDSYILETIFIWLLLLVIYLALMALGFWVFPPLVICLMATGGDLASCSFNIWE